jgi:CMP-N-acetylneuraminic acid synthetase
MIGSKSLIGHAVVAARDTKRVDTVVVSSDDEQIRKEAAEFGAEIPFERPPQLATDSSQVQDVITHALESYKSHSETYDVVVMVLPTTPLRSSDDIDATLDRLERSNATAAISTSEFQTPPFWAIKSDGEYLEEYFETDALWTDDKIPRSQDLPDLTHPNGAVFASTVSAWYEYETFYQPRTIEYKMPRLRSIDIDTIDDLRLARKLASVNDMPEK